MTSDTFTMPLIIRALGRGKKGSRDLSYEEAYFTMQSILGKTITAPQLGAFLMLMRVKEETPVELAGMVAAAHDFLASAPITTTVDVNWPAYAGKKKQPSWYVAAAKLLAQNGVTIIMHGGGEHTAGRQYASEASDALNIPIANTLEKAVSNIANNNICYISLDSFLPTLSDIIDMKAELGLRSPANTLVRHLNPLNATLTLQGMFHPAYMPMHHLAAIELQQNNNIVLKGDGGEFEVRPDSATPIQIFENDTLDMTSYPAALRRRSVRPETVTMEPLVALWNGQIENEYGEAAVIETASLVLSQLKGTPLHEARSLTQSWWANRVNL